MSRTTYDQARADHEYLWSIGPAQDMTGGYVDQEDLDKLLKNPTKAQARDCYCDQIAHWFTVGPDCDGQSDIQHYIDTDFTVRDIAERHGFRP